MFSGSSEPGLHTQSRCASLKAGRDKSGSLWSTLTHASPSSLPACRAAWARSQRIQECLDWPVTPTPAPRVSPPPCSCSAINLPCWQRPKKVRPG